MMNVEQDQYDKQTGVISKKFLKKLVKSDFKQYYRTPELNDILYLHFKSFKKIDNLQDYTGLKVLYLEGNCIKKLENLQKLVNLRCLYVQENVIEIIEGLEENTQLSNLNLSDNMLEKIEGLGTLGRLQNLLLKNNRIGLGGLSDVTGLLDCPSISCLDIQSNKIDNPDFLHEVLRKMEKIAVVYLQNNDFTKKVVHYRKTLITQIPDLKYIDDKPIFDDEKRYAIAWARGGLDQERKERVLYKKEQEQAHIRQHNQFREMMERHREQRVRQREARERETTSETDSKNQSNSQGESLETYKTPEDSEKTSEKESEESQSKKNQESLRDSESQRNSEKEPSEKAISEKEMSENAVSEQANQKDGYLNELD